MDIVPDSMYAYRVGIICALSLELAAVKAMLDGHYQQPQDFLQDERDDNSYTWGRMGSHNVIVASLPTGKYGQLMAATAAIRMKDSFDHLEFALVIGIGGGIPFRGDIRLGDVVVSKPSPNAPSGVFQYDFGKYKQGVWERKNLRIELPKLLLKALSNMESCHALPQIKAYEHYDDAIARHEDWAKLSKFPIVSDRLFHSSSTHINERSNYNCKLCDQIYLINRPVRRRPRDFKVHYGLMASGDLVVADSELRSWIARLEDECKCIEMEGAMVMETMPCIIIRGISDYADPHKNDLWQRYAAAAAAAVGKELLSRIRPRAPSRDSLHSGSRRSSFNGSVNSSWYGETQKTTESRSYRPADSKELLSRGRPRLPSRDSLHSISRRSSFNGSVDSSWNGQMQSTTGSKSYWPDDSKDKAKRRSWDAYAVALLSAVAGLLLDARIARSRKQPQASSYPLAQIMSSTGSFGEEQDVRPPSAPSQYNEHEAAAESSLISRTTGVMGQTKVLLIGGSTVWLDTLLSTARAEDRIKLNNWTPQYPNAAYDKHKNTALHIAAQTANLGGLEFFLKCGADIDVENNGQEQPIHIAAEKGHTHCVEFLLAHGASTEVKDFFENTPLHLSAKHGHPKVVRLLLESRANIESTNSWGMTALHEAASQHRIGVLDVLLESNADFEAKTDIGWTPMHFAANCGSLSAINSLVSSGATVNSVADRSNDESPLLLSARRGNASALILLLNDGATISYKDSSGRDALYYASCYGHSDTVKALLERKADVRAVDYYGNTALHIAARRGREGVVAELLTSVNTGLRVKNKRGQRPIDKAMASGNGRIVALLRKASVERQNIVQRWLTKLIRD